MTKQLAGHQIVTVLHENSYDSFLLCDAIHAGKPCIHNFKADGNYDWDEDAIPTRCSFREHINGMSDFAAYRENGTPYTIFSAKVNYDSSTHTAEEEPKGDHRFELKTESESIGFYIDGVNMDPLDFPISILSISPIIWNEHPDEVPLWNFTGQPTHYRPTDPEWKQTMDRFWVG